MLEFILCSLVTIFPDYLFRRYAQGKRWGREINFFSMWYELRWGLTSCAILTISFITVIFYYHPSTSNVTSFFRTVTILPESGGRVAEVLVKNEEDVALGQPLFRLDDISQRSAVETAGRRISEVDAAMVVAQSDLAAASAVVDQAQSSLAQTQDEYDRKKTLFDQDSPAVSRTEIERLENLLGVRQGALDAANAGLEAADARIKTLLPAQKASAEAALAQAEAELSKTVVYAGVDGRVTQFSLQVGDFVSPVLRPAGILIPKDSGIGRFQAGFGQISAQVIRPGMLAEITCVSKPFTVIPMVVTNVQEVIATGQFRPGDQLVDAQERARLGSLTVFMEPLYPGQADDVPPGSKCIANAYTNNHDKLDDEGLSTGTWLFYHMVDAVGLVHALILRMQALALPVQMLVFTGH